MITNIGQIDRSKVFSYADYLNWRFEEKIELIKGKIFPMSPAPSLRHQRVSMRLIGTMLSVFKTHSCDFFHAPFDVRLTDSRRKKKWSDGEIYTVVQPDLCVVCDPSKLDEKGCLGAPDWIIEILSPGSLSYDLKKKYRLYEENKVKEYWLVNPMENYIQTFALQKDGHYGHYRILSDDEDDFVSPVLFPELNISLKEIFE